MKIIMIYCNTQSAGPIGNPTVRAQLCIGLVGVCPDLQVKAVRVACLRQQLLGQLLPL